MKKLFDRDPTSNFSAKLDVYRLKQLCGEVKIDERDHSGVIKVFELLFDNSSSTVETKSIRRLENFDLYFDNAVNTKGILFRDFTPLLEKPWAQIEPKIYKWISEGKEGYLIDLLYDTDPFRSRERFEKITYICVLLTNRRIRTDFIIGTWIDVISNNFQFIEQFYGSDRGFFTGLFRRNVTPFFNSTYTIAELLRRYIKGDNDFRFPLTKEELSELAIERLCQYIESRREFDIRVFSLFYYNCWKNVDDRNHVQLLEEAGKLVRKYIDRYPEGYLRFTIRSKYTPHIDQEYTFEPFIEQYFGSWDAFEKFLKQQAERNGEFRRMSQYFEAFKNSSYVSFKAESAPPWIEIDANGNSSMKYFKHQTYDAFAEEMDKVRQELSNKQTNR